LATSASRPGNIEHGDGVDAIYVGNRWHNGAHGREIAWQRACVAQSVRSTKWHRSNVNIHECRSVRARQPDSERRGKGITRTPLRRTKQFGERQF
jgi:hypothetical protein